MMDTRNCKQTYKRLTPIGVCVCVCERERERERESVSQSLLCKWAGYDQLNLLGVGLVIV
jgi:hypothetical protein